MKRDLVLFIFLIIVINNLQDNQQSRVTDYNFIYNKNSIFSAYKAIETYINEAIDFNFLNIFNIIPKSYCLSMKHKKIPVISSEYSSKKVTTNIEDLMITKKTINFTDFNSNDLQHFFLYDYLLFTNIPIGKYLYSNSKSIIKKNLQGELYSFYTNSFSSNNTRIAKSLIDNFDLNPMDNVYNDFTYNNRTTLTYSYLASDSYCLIYSGFVSNKNTCSEKSLVSIKNFANMITSQYHSQQCTNIISDILCRFKCSVDNYKYYNTNKGGLSYINISFDTCLSVYESCSNTDISGFTDTILITEALLYCSEFNLPFNSKLNIDLNDIFLEEVFNKSIKDLRLFDQEDFNMYNENTSLLHNLPNNNFSNNTEITKSTIYANPINQTNLNSGNNGYDNVDIKFTQLSLRKFLDIEISDVDINNNNETSSENQIKNINSTYNNFISNNNTYKNTNNILNKDKFDISTKDIEEIKQYNQIKTLIDLVKQLKQEYSFNIQSKNKIHIKNKLLISINQLVFNISNSKNDDTHNTNFLSTVINRLKSNNQTYALSSIFKNTEKINLMNQNTLYNDLLSYLRENIKFLFNGKNSNTRELHYKVISQMLYSSFFKLSTLVQTKIKRLIELSVDYIAFEEKFRFDEFNDIDFISYKENKLIEAKVRLLSVVLVKIGKYVNELNDNISYINLFLDDKESGINTNDNKYSNYSKNSERIRSELVNIKEEKLLFYILLKDNENILNSYTSWRQSTNDLVEGVKDKISQSFTDYVNHLLNSNEHYKHYFKSNNKDTQEEQYQRKVEVSSNEDDIIKDINNHLAFNIGNLHTLMIKAIISKYQENKLIFQDSLNLNDTPKLQENDYFNNIKLLNSLRSSSLTQININKLFTKADFNEKRGETNTTDINRLVLDLNEYYKSLDNAYSVSENDEIIQRLKRVVVDVFEKNYTKYDNYVVIDDEISNKDLMINTNITFINSKDSNESSIISLNDKNNLSKEAELVNKTLYNDLSTNITNSTSNAVAINESNIIKTNKSLTLDSNTIANMIEEVYNELKKNKSLYEKYDKEISEVNSIPKASLNSLSVNNQENEMNNNSTELNEVINLNKTSNISVLNTTDDNKDKSLVDNDIIENGLLNKTVELSDSNNTIEELSFNTTEKIDSIKTEIVEEEVVNKNDNIHSKADVKENIVKTENIDNKEKKDIKKDSNKLPTENPINIKTNASNTGIEMSEIFNYNSTNTENTDTNNKDNTSLPTTHEKNKEEETKTNNNQEDQKDQLAVQDQESKDTGLKEEEDDENENDNKANSNLINNTTFENVTNEFEFDGFILFSFLPEGVNTTTNFIFYITIIIILVVSYFVGYFNILKKSQYFLRSKGLKYKKDSVNYKKMILLLISVSAINAVIARLLYSEIIVLLLFLNNSHLLSLAIGLFADTGKKIGPISFSIEAFLISFKLTQNNDFPIRILICFGSILLSFILGALIGNKRIINYERNEILIRTAMNRPIRRSERVDNTRNQDNNDIRCLNENRNDERINNL